MEQYQSEEKADLENYLRVILKRKWIIIIITIICLIVGLFYVLRTPAIYEATSTIQIKQNNSPSASNTPFILPVAFSNYGNIDSEIEIIKSRVIREKIVKKFHLDQKIYDISGKIKPEISNVKIDKNLRDKEFKIKLAGDRDIINKPYKTKGLSFLLTCRNVNKGDSFKFMVEDLPTAAEGLKSKIKITKVGKTRTSTNIVKISVKDTNPERARNIANAIVNFYIQEDISRKSKTATMALNFINQQVYITKNNLDRSELALNRYKTRKGIMVLTEQAKATIDKITDLEKTKANITIQEKQIEDLHQQLKNGGFVNFNPSGMAALGDPVIVGMLSRLSNLDVTKKSLLSQYTEKHPQVIAVTSEIEELRKKLLLSIENSLTTLRGQRHSIEGIIDRYKGNLKLLPKAEQDLANLVRESTVQEGIYTLLLNKQKEMSIAQASTISNIRIIDAALIPRLPANTSSKLKNVIISIILGLFLGISLAFFLDYLDDTIKSSEEIEKKLGLPIYGIIPHMNGLDKHKVFTSEASLDNPTSSVFLSNPSSKGTQIAQKKDGFKMIESYRSLRTNIQFADIEKKNKVFLITSPNPEEGKTTTIANLSYILSIMDIKVLIIDSDLRKPCIHRIFNVNREPGLTDILIGEKKPEETIQPTSIKNLYLITAGATPPNPTELLFSSRTDKLIQDLRENFNFIFFDSPPLLAFADAPTLATKVDGVFAVLRAEKTTFKTAKAMQEILEKNVHAKIIGVILNDVKPSLAKYYGDYRYYHYHEYYGDSHKKSKKGDFFTKLFKKS
ncbi:MAG: polysaccharide biosynthesis tyrosine autokinase [Campylobacterota bacterium]|nr:polysaccharide biosynthesis tyrosine autokinase [Campylobacterota bacterium]